MQQAGDPVGEGDPIPPNAALLAHARNRWLHAGLGTWTANDPNASGQPVVAQAAFHALALHPGPSSYSLLVNHRDGPNLFAAYRHRPHCGGDALGLHYALEFGQSIGDMAASLTDQYSFNMQLDLEWALDWSQGDDTHSRLNNDWIYDTIQASIAGSFRDMLLGPFDMVEDAFEAGQEIGEYLFGESGNEYADTNAGLERKSVVQSIKKHGGKLHRTGIIRLMANGRSYGATLFNVRVNRNLLDPVTGQELSKMRPDYFAFVPEKNLIILGESCVSQSLKAAERKLEEMERLYRPKFHVRRLPPEKM